MLSKSVVRVSFSILAKRESAMSKGLWHLNAGNFRASVKIRWASLEARSVNIALKQPHFTVWKLLKAELGHCNSNVKARYFHKYHIKPSMLCHKSNLIPQSSNKKCQLWNLARENRYSIWFKGMGSITTF